MHIIYVIWLHSYIAIYVAIILVIKLCALRTYPIGVIYAYCVLKLLYILVQHPSIDTYCEGSNALLSCVIFDNTATNAADTTSWFTNDNPPAAVLDSYMINNTRDGDVVTSVLTIESVSLNDNGNGYFCSPSFGIRSNVGVI